MNNSIDRSWKAYYARTSHRPPSSSLQRAITLLSLTGEKTALDLGCGAGIETQYLLEKEFHVTAVDQQVEALEYLFSLPFQHRLRAVCAPFETFSFGCYDIIHAHNSLSFLSPAAFSNVWEAIQHALNPGGFFVGTFFGTHDSWQQQHYRQMTFFEYAEVRMLLSHWQIIDLNEQENDADTALGEKKHWHVFHVIAKNKIVLH